MNSITTTIRNRRIELAAPDELPDGTEIRVEVTPWPNEKIGLTEAEWRDDPEARADWSTWLKSLEPMDFTAEDQAESDRFNEEFVRFNLEAVRKQMAEEPLP